MKGGRNHGIGTRLDRDVIKARQVAHRPDFDSVRADAQAEPCGLLAWVGDQQRPVIEENGRSLGHNAEHQNTRRWCWRRPVTPSCSGSEAESQAA